MAERRDIRIHPEDWGLIVAGNMVWMGDHWARWCRDYTREELEQIGIAPGEEP